MRLPKVAVKKGIAQIQKCDACGGNSSTGCLGPNSGSPLQNCNVYLESSSRGNAGQFPV